MRTLIVGCGYVGKSVAERLIAEGDDVLGVTRTERSADKLRKSDIPAIAFDWLKDENKLTHEAFEIVIVAVSHAPVEGVPPEETHVRGLQALLGGLKRPPMLLLYCSTTGVIRDSANASWVDESAPVLATRPGTINALAAERWLESNWSLSPFVILRLAGVYGPERVPNIDALKNTRPLQVDPDSYLNLIHVRDISATVVAMIGAMIESPLKHRLYLVSDGHPVRRRSYYEWLSQHFQLSPPNFQPFDPTRAPTNRGFGNKRISNRRIVEEFNLRWSFPTFREGLETIPLCFDKDSQRQTQL